MNIFLPQLALLGLSPTMKDGSDFGGCGGKSWLASIMFKAKNQALERNRGSNGGKNKSQSGEARTRAKEYETRNAKNKTRSAENGSGKRVEKGGK